MKPEEDAAELNVRNVSTAEVSDTQAAMEEGESPPSQYLEGARLHVLTATWVSLGLLKAFYLEIPIVSTSLVSIAGDLGALEKIYWITTAYMIGYAGLMVLSAKLSDIFGRKTCLLVTFVIFIIFSAACGAAQTMNQLITFRTFQGIGGAGNYALCTIIVLEVVPPEKFAKYSGIIAAMFVFSLLLGPLFGGAITEHSTWRWIFLLNIPPGAVVLLSFIVVLPNGFPFHNTPRETRSSLRESFEKAFRRIDIIGAFLLLAATVLLVAGLDEADEQFAWRSAFTITVLVISGILWVLFVIWERRVTLNASAIEPVFPWRFFQNRVWIAMLLNAVFLGMTWFVTMFILPQRFEIVNGLSSFDAAVRFIPFTVLAPVGSMVAPAIAKIFRVPIMYILAVGSVIQIMAYALMGTLSDQHDISARQYGYQVLAGFGCGIGIVLLSLMTPFATEKRDYGGDVVEAILQSTSAIAALPTDTQDLVRETYGASYNIQMKILAGMAGAQLLTSMMMWRKNPIVAA
ncbi:MFS general substrate transporter [Penicillium angulare]|uniref:MFS general substrate transporter n=1 Tax=Penicillium angulare TaxID=116970 RepID=A0A9W9KII9_9EURO|nr:MFS general substrate transporter [Penicillium angulare]